MEYQNVSFKFAVVSRSGFGRFHYKLQLVSGVIMFAAVLDILSSSYVAPAAQCEFKLSSGEKGLLYAILYIGMIFSSHLWGFLADTQGRRKVLLVTLFSDFICTSIGAFMPTIELLIISRFISGFLICASSAVVYPYVGEFHSSSTRCSAIVQLSIFLALALVAEPGLAWLIIPLDFVIPLGSLEFRSWRLFMLVIAIPSGLAALCLLFFLPESPKYLMAHGRDEESLKTLQNVYTTNTKLPIDLYPVSSIILDDDSSVLKGINMKDPKAVIRYMWSQTYPLLKKPYCIVTVLSCTLQFGLYCGSNGFLMWMPDLYNRISDYNKLNPNSPKPVCDVIGTLAVNITSPINPMPQLAFARSAHLTKTFNKEMCDDEVDTLSFQNTLIIGSTMAVAYTIVSIVISYVNKRMLLDINIGSMWEVQGSGVPQVSMLGHLLVASTIASAIFGVATLWAESTTAVLLFPLFFILCAGMCVNVVTSITMDLIPTQLRAMVVCLSLMCGRSGVAVSSLILGFLIDANCEAAICSVSALVVFVGLLSLLMPSVQDMRS